MNGLRRAKCIYTHMYILICSYCYFMSKFRIEHDPEWNNKRINKYIDILYCLRFDLEIFNRYTAKWDTEKTESFYTDRLLINKHWLRGFYSRVVKISKKLGNFRVQLNGIHYHVQLRPDFDKLFIRTEILPT